jgi:hypothetical protein
MLAVGIDIAEDLLPELAAPPQAVSHSPASRSDVSASLPISIFLSTAGTLRGMFIPHTETRRARVMTALARSTVPRFGIHFFFKMMRTRF